MRLSNLLGSSVLPKVALVAKRLDVRDVIGTSARERNDVIFGPDIAVARIGPLGNLRPLTAAPGTRIVRT